MPLRMINTPTTAWKMSGRKINVHSTSGNTGPRAWILSTWSWKVAAPASTEALVSKWMTMYAPTGNMPLSECRRRIRNWCLEKKQEGVVSTGNLSLIPAIRAGPWGSFHTVARNTAGQNAVDTGEIEDFQVENARSPRAVAQNW